MDQQMTILVSPTSTGYVPVLLHPGDPYKELPSSPLGQAPSSIDVTRKNGQRYLNSMIAKRFPGGATSASEILDRLQNSEALTNTTSQDLAMLRKLCDDSGMDLQLVAWASDRDTGECDVDRLTRRRVEQLASETPESIRVPRIK
jgi:hypothetical protein